MFREHDAILARGGLITRGCESAEENYLKGQRTEEPRAEFSILRGSDKRVQGLCDRVARGVSLADGTAQKTLWLGLVAPKMVDLLQPLFGSSCAEFLLASAGLERAVLAWGCGVRG